MVVAEQVLGELEAGEVAGPEATATISAIVIGCLASLSTSMSARRWRV
jgi:hypothetical protein